MYHSPYQNYYQNKNIQIFIVFRDLTVHGQYSPITYIGKILIPSYYLSFDPKKKLTILDLWPSVIKNFLYMFIIFNYIFKG